MVRTPSLSVKEDGVLPYTYNDWHVVSTRQMFV